MALDGHLLHDSIYFGRVAEIKLEYTTGLYAAQRLVVGVALRAGRIVLVGRTGGCEEPRTVGELV